MVLAPLSASFQPLPPSKWCPSGADSRVVGLCTFWDPVGLSNKLFCEAGIFSCCHLNPQGVFNQWFEALFPQRWSPEVAWSVSPFVPPSLSACECGTTGSASHCLTGSASCCLASQLHQCPPCSAIHCLAGPSSHHLAASPVHPAACFHPFYQSG